MLDALVATAAAADSSSLNPAQLAAGGVAGIILLVGMAIVVPALYMAPAIVAYKRRHKNRLAIAVTCLFTGWTAIGWIAALIWAFTESQARENAAQPVRICLRCGRSIAENAQFCPGCGARTTAEPERGGAV
jgi:hypothetical protein